MQSFIVLLAAGAVAYNGTLGDVRERRNSLYGAELPTEGYECLAGVQHRYSALLGKDVFFYDFETGGVIKLLVVDTQAPQHKGIMQRRFLAIDSDCDWMVSRHGVLFLTEEFNHPDTVSLRVTDDVISRVRAIFRGGHRLCGDGLECHWKVREWAWN